MTELIFTINQDEDGDWSGTLENDPIFFLGKSVEEIRERVASHVKDTYGDDIFWIRFETNSKEYTF